MFETFFYLKMNKEYWGIEEVIVADVEKLDNCSTNKLSYSDSNSESSDEE